MVAHLRTASSKTKFPRTFEDKPFPALWSALNAEIMNDDLSPILNDVVCSQTSSRVVHRAKLLAYKPGKRGVIRYDLDQIECQKYFSVYGKLYPEPYLSERAYRVMRTLYDEVFCDDRRSGCSGTPGGDPKSIDARFCSGRRQIAGRFHRETRIGGP